MRSRAVTPRRVGKKDGRYLANIGAARRRRGKNRHAGHVPNNSKRAVYLHFVSIVAGPIHVPRKTIGRGAHDFDTFCQVASLPDRSSRPVNWTPGNPLLLACLLTFQQRYGLLDRGRNINLNGKYYHFAMGDMQ